MESARRTSSAERHRRTRAAKRAQGLREVRLWVPDLRNPAVLAEVARQGKLLRDAPEQGEASLFLTDHLLGHD